MYLDVLCVYGIVKSNDMGSIAFTIFFNKKNWDLEWSNLPKFTGIESLAVF